MQDSGLSVLIADSDEKGGISLRNTFSALGYKAHWVIDGISALDKVSDFAPDLVIIDMEIEEMNALQVCEAMQQMPDLSHTVFIAQGRGHSEDTHKTAKRAGFHYYMQKPIQVDALVHLLGRPGLFKGDGTLNMIAPVAPAPAKLI